MPSEPLTSLPSPRRRIAIDPAPDKPVYESAALEPVVLATAQEVLPGFGLAYLVDDRHRTWAVSRSTQGPGLDSLRPGRRVRLTLDHHEAFSVVRLYAPLE